MSSDARWKKSIKTLQSPLQKVLNMSGVSYHYRRDEFPDKNFQEGAQIGFIAQQLEAVVPEVVRTDSQGWKSVQYSSLVPVLVEAFKQLVSCLACNNMFANEVFNAIVVTRFQYAQVEAQRVECNDKISWMQQNNRDNARQIRKG